MSLEIRKHGSVRRAAIAPGKITRRKKVSSQKTLSTVVQRVSPQNVRTTKKEGQLSNELFEKLASCAITIPLPGEMWLSYVECGSHIMFAKIESDLQFSFKLVIYPDVAKISYYGKVLSWMEPNIKSEAELINVLQFLDVLKLPKILP